MDDVDDLIALIRVMDEESVREAFRRAFPGQGEIDEFDA